MSRHPSSIIPLLMILSGVAAAQSFEVASIKLHPPNTPCADSVTPPGGLLIFQCWPLAQMIRESYDVLPEQISGGEPWVASEPWDIVAKAEGFPGEIPVEKWRPMMRRLLEEQFHLKLRVEKKSAPIFALLTVKPNKKGKPAPALKPNTGAPFTFNLTRGPSVTTTGITMQQFAAWLKNFAPGRRIVIDKTGMTGQYDFTLQWAPPQPDAPGPTLFTALQEQLGLRIESQRASIDHLFIEQATRPQI